MFSPKCLKIILKRFSTMSIDVSQYVDVSSERKSFVWNHMLLYKEKGVEYKCITINCVVNILTLDLLAPDPFRIMLSKGGSLWKL